MACKKEEKACVCHAIKGLFKEPLGSLNELQDTRWPWLLMIIVTFGLTCVAHYLFQDYLFMEPCEQCVYIRFAMLIMAIGGILAVFRPGCPVAKTIGYALGFYGIIIGIHFCLNLNEIHDVVHHGNPFGGVDGCREIPIYPFHLPLQEWFPGWFMPTGECGLDNPIVPESMYDKLSSIQQFFVGTKDADFMNGLYSNGWYLIPKWEFMNMAIACLIAFVICLICLGALCVGFIARGGKKGKIVGILSIIIAVLLAIAS